MVNFTAFSYESTKDTSHASFLLRINFVHKLSGISFTGMLTSEPVAELQQKTQSAGLWDKSLA